MSDIEKKAYRMLKEYLRGENKSIDKIKEAIDILISNSISIAKSIARPSILVTASFSNSLTN